MYPSLKSFIYFFSIACCIVCSVFVRNAFASDTAYNIHPESYDILSTDLPPWSMPPGSGIFTEIIKGIEEHIEQNHTPIFLPWSRAQSYATSARDKAYFIYPISRIKSREKHYKWAVKVMPSRLVFASLHKPVKSIKQAKALNGIVVHQDSPPFHYLKSQKFDNLIFSSVGVGSVYSMLSMKRAEAWFTAEAIARYTALQNGINEKIHYSSVYSQNWLYIAASANMADEVIHAYREAFVQLQQSGKIEAIKQRYLGVHEQ